MKLLVILYGVEKKVEELIGKVPLAENVLEKNLDMQRRINEILDEGSSSDEEMEQEPDESPNGSKTKENSEDPTPPGKDAEVERGNVDVMEE